jgi:hypothetical protein
MKKRSYNLHFTVLSVYLHENLDLIIIFFTLLQKKYLKRYILANIIIVLLFPIAAICCNWEKKNNDNISQTISFLLAHLTQRVM